MDNYDTKNTTNNKVSHNTKVKRMPIWGLVIMDIVLTAACLGLFTLYHYVLPRQLESAEIVVASAGDSTDTSFKLPGSESDSDDILSDALPNSGTDDNDLITKSGNTTSDQDDEEEPSEENPSEENTSSSEEDPSEENPTSNEEESTSDNAVAGSDSDNGTSVTVKPNNNNTKGGFNYGNSDTTEIMANTWESKVISSADKTLTQVNSYSSEHIQFTTDKVEIGNGNDKITYYVSDIYVTNVEYLKTAFAKDKYGKNYKESTLKIASAHDSLLAINGDYYGNNEIGVVIRNGVLFRSEVYDADLCVLYTDGTMETYSPNEFDLDEVVARGAWQAWIFGPQLLDGSGNILSTFNSTNYLSNAHPRTAIGYVEPGHYVFVVVDGRDDGYSRGATLTELAQIMADSGCVTAYNLDGGGSSEMVYADEHVNQPCDDRDVSDIIYISELE